MWFLFHPQWGPLSDVYQASTPPGTPEQCSIPNLTLNTCSSVLVTWEVSSHTVSVFRWLVEIWFNFWKLINKCFNLFLLQSPACNESEIYKFQVEWGLEESALELLYSGPLCQYEVRDLQPATQYYCRVQVGTMLWLLKPRKRRYNTFNLHVLLDKMSKHLKKKKVDWPFQQFTKVDR